MTGAGRSTAAKELEDLGFYVVDNLPPSLLRDVVRLVDESRGAEQPIAVVVDVRSGSFFQTLQANLAQGATGRHATLLFLEATDDVLVRRQEAARRPHPLQGSGRLLDGLQPRARGAGRPAQRRRPGHRHHRRSTCTSSPTGSPRRSAPPRRTAAEGHRGQLRVQVRHPRRRRLRGRHAVPAQPVLGPGAAAAAPAATPRCADYVHEPARRRGVPRRLRAGARAASPRATSARASGS